MSERSNTTSISIPRLVKGSVFAALLELGLMLLAALPLAALLHASGTPERFYAYSSVLLLVLPALIVGRIFSRKTLTVALATALLSSLILLVAGVALSLALRCGDTQSLFISSLILFFSFVAGSVTSSGTKRKKRKKKKR